MSKKFVFVISLIIVASMMLAACTKATPTAAPAATEAPATEADCAKAEVMCIGLVTDVGEVDDKSFNQSSWEGVVQGGKEVGAIVNYVETKDAKDYGANMQLFIDKGYDVIVTVGFAITDATVAAAVANPNVKFIGVDQYQASVTANVAGLIFDEAKSGFLAGVLAGMLTKTKTIAAVLGTDLVPPVVNFNRGYIAGAKWVDANINVISTYHPGGMDVAFTDPDWGATTARQAIGQKADVIFGAGGKTGNGALIETAGNPGLYCIGVDTDQWDTVPEAQKCLVSSATKAITPSIIALIKTVKDGTFPAGNYVGGSALAPFHDFDSVVTQETKDKLAAGLKAYEANEIVLP